MRLLGIILATCSLALCATADIAPVISWQVDTAKPVPFPLSIRRGETVVLEADHDRDFTGATNAVLEYRPIGSTLPPYAATGTIYNATAGVVRVRWDSTTEGTNAAYSYEIVVRSSNATVRRATGTITVLDSLAGDSVLPTPPTGYTDTLAPSDPEAVYPNDIATVIAWDVDPTDLVPYNFPLVQGDTAILRPRYLGKDFSGAGAVALRYRPVGAKGWHYAAPGSIHNATGGVASVRWDSTTEGTNTAYQYEVAVQSAEATLLRAYGTITVKPSLSGSSTSMPTRVTTFDWATVDHVNIGSAPFLSEVILAPFSALWASLTNGTADLSVGSLLVDGLPVGSGGGGIGSFTNVQIAGVDYTNSVRIGDGSNLTWRLRAGVWRPDVPVIQGPQGPAGTPTTNIIISVTTNLTIMTMIITNITIGGGGVGSYTNTSINGVPHTNGIMIADSYNSTWTQGTDGVWRVDMSTNQTQWVVNGEHIGGVNSNGITLLKGTLQLYEEDLDCNVRLYDGSRIVPSLTFQGHPGEWGMYARGYNGHYVAGWSVASNEVGLLHAGGIRLMDTNAAFEGQLIGDISDATGYPEPIFESWRTNMQFSYLSISNLTLTSQMETRDINGTTRATLDNAGSLTLRNAAGIIRSLISDGILYIRDSLGRTTAQLDTRLRIYEPVSGMKTMDVGGTVGEELSVWTPSGYQVASLSGSGGLNLMDLGSYIHRVAIRPEYFWLANASSQTVFRVTASSGVTEMMGATITNSMSLTFYGPNGTNLMTLGGSDGGLKVRGQDSDIRYGQAAPTNMLGFVLTNVFANITNRLWFSAQGVVTNHVP